MTTQKQAHSKQSCWSLRPGSVSVSLLNQTAVLYGDLASISTMAFLGFHVQNGPLFLTGGLLLQHWGKFRYYRWLHWGLTMKGERLRAQCNYYNLVHVCFNLCIKVIWTLPLQNWLDSWSPTKAKQRMLALHELRRPPIFASCLGPHQRERVVSKYLASQKI